MRSSPPNLILVAKVAGGFGVRGEIRLNSYTAHPEALMDYGPLLRQDGKVALSMTTGRAQKNDLIGRAKEVETKEAADALRGLRLYVPRDALPTPEDEDEFYLTDLLGLTCVTETGEVLGKVKSVPNFGAGDLLEIDPGLARPTFYLPFTRAVAPEIHLERAEILIVPPTETSERDPV